MRPSMSEVHTMFWKISHAKNFPFGSAHIFQIVASFGVLMQQ
jgi:hypothetical protein